MPWVWPLGFYFSWIHPNRLYLANRNPPVSLTQTRPRAVGASLDVIGAAVRRAVDDEVPGAAEEETGPTAVRRVRPGPLDARVFCLADWLIGLAPGFWIEEEEGRSRLRQGRFTVRNPKRPNPTQQAAISDLTARVLSEKKAAARATVWPSSLAGGGEVAF